jgi:predicted nucleic acid-binding protein
VQEFAHVRARRRERTEAAERARDYAELLAPLLVVDREQLDRGLSLFASLADLGAFDAVLAASALNAGASAVASADRGFGVVEGLEYVFPDAHGVASLIDRKWA